jgi:hypothetical protein
MNDIALMAIINYIWNTSGNIHRSTRNTTSFIYTRSQLESDELGSFGYSRKIFHVFVCGMYLSKSSLSIRIYDLNVCPTLNSPNFKSNFRN